MRRTLLAGLAVAVGCRTVPQMPVQLKGDPTSIAWLAGSWTGEYWGGVGGRGGSLSFTLRSGTDSLYGDVTMMDPHGQQLRPADPTDVHALHVRSPRRLRIDVVRVETTTFMGRVEGDRITGDFSTRAGGRVRAEGSWEMKRVGEGR